MILKELSKLKLSKKIEDLYESLFKCYEKLVEIEIIKKEELTFLDAWMEDLKGL